MIPITIYARVDALQQIFVEDRAEIKEAAARFCEDLVGRARVVDKSAELVESMAHVEIHVGSDHSSRC
jgi:hypothetical protein